MVSKFVFIPIDQRSHLITHGYTHLLFQTPVHCTGTETCNNHQTELPKIPICTILSRITIQFYLAPLKVLNLYELHIEMSQNAPNY
jgi:hypothetical protein